MFSRVWTRGLYDLFYRKTCLSRSSACREYCKMSNTLLCQKSCSAQPLLCQDSRSSKRFFSGGEHAHEDMHIATLDDMNDVVAIDENVYDGLDRVPYLYPEMIKAPNARGFVYTKGERTVGFMKIKLIDGGQSLFLTALRMVPDMRGDGTFWRFRHSALKEFIPSAGLKYIVGIADHTVNLQKIRRNFDVLEVKKTTRYELDLREARKKVSQHPLHTSSGLHEMSRGDIRNLMSYGPENVTDLFHSGVMTVSYVPYGIMPANTDLIFGGHNRQILTSSADLDGENLYPFRNAAGVARQDASSIAKENTSSSGHGSCLTCFTFDPCKVGIRCELDVHGTGSEDQLRAHFERHFLFLLENCPDAHHAVILVLCSEGISAKVSRVMKELQSSFGLFPSKKYLPFDDFVLRANYQEVVKLNE